MKKLVAILVLLLISTICISTICIARNTGGQIKEASDLTLQQITKLAVYTTENLIPSHSDRANIYSLLAIAKSIEHLADVIEKQNCTKVEVK